MRPSVTRTLLRLDNRIALATGRPRFRPGTRGVVCTGTGPGRGSIVIATTPRSGSTLLAEALTSTGLAGQQIEFLHANAMMELSYVTGRPRLGVRTHLRLIYRIARRRDRWWAVPHSSPRARRAYVDTLVRERRGDDGTFGLKVHWEQFDDFVRRGHDPIDWLPRPIVWIRLVRHDLLAQAISWERANQTDRWTSRDRHASGEPSFDAQAIADRIARLQRLNDAWDVYLANVEGRVLTVSYEDLDANFDGTLRRLMVDIGCGAATYDAPDLARQADGVNDEWRQRFLEQHPRASIALRTGGDASSGEVDPPRRRAPRPDTRV